jgi:alpha-tubulin suppressor-like RCC1 family protein
MRPPAFAAMSEIGLFVSERCPCPARLNSDLLAGNYHACAVRSDGSAYCWGFGDYGGLGNGSKTSSPTPVAVAGGLKFVSVSAGLDQTCGVTRSGHTLCWGRNEHGQLGDSTTVSSAVPVPVKESSQCTSLEADSGMDAQHCIAGAHTSSKTRIWSCINETGQRASGRRSDDATAGLGRASYAPQTKLRDRSAPDGPWRDRGPRSTDAALIDFRCHTN